MAGMFYSTISSMRELTAVDTKTEPAKLSDLNASQWLPTVALAYDFFEHVLVHT